MKSFNNKTKTQKLPHVSYFFARKPLSLSAQSSTTSEPPGGEKKLLLRKTSTRFFCSEFFQLWRCVEFTRERVCSLRRGCQVQRFSSWVQKVRRVQGVQEPRRGLILTKQISTWETRSPPFFVRIEVII